MLSLCDGKLFNRGLSRLGEISLELYLSHVMIRVIFKHIGLPTHNILNYLIVIALSFAVSIGVNLLLKRISKNEVRYV